MDTRGQWVTVAAVLRYTYVYTWPVGDSGCSAAIHIWIHVDSGVTMAAGLRYTYRYTWTEVHSGCCVADTHSNTRGQWVTGA